MPDEAAALAALAAKHAAAKRAAEEAQIKAPPPVEVPPLAAYLDRPLGRCGCGAWYTKDRVGRIVCGAGTGCGLLVPPRPAEAKETAVISLPDRAGWDDDED